jgi:adenylyltransferase/sulfurtransferase
LSSRYARHIVLPEIGEEKQAALAGKKVAIVGCGGLGGPVAVYLAGAGVGQLTLIDGDTPDISNLHRQVFFSNEHSQGNKTEALKAHISQLNPDVTVRTVTRHLDKPNADILLDHDLVLDCVDRLEIKYLISDYCHINKIPVVYAAVYKFEGYVTVFINRDKQSIHLRDIFPQSDATVPNCESIGVLNTAVGMIAMMQANEAMKLLLGIGQLLEGKLLWYEALENEQFKVSARKTFNGNMLDVWQENEYESTESCASELEIPFESAAIMKNALFVSLLEDWEISKPFRGELHLPFSKFDVKSPLLKTSHPIIFYCQSGIRSASAVNQYVSVFPGKEAYSLKGGIRALN